MFYSCVQSLVTVEVDTLVSKRSKLIGHKARLFESTTVRNPQKGDLCVLQLASSSCPEAQQRAQPGLDVLRLLRIFVNVFQTSKNLWVTG